MNREEEKLIQRDRMRFTKNSLSSTLVYVAILFDVFFFVSIYKSDVGSWYYNILIGASILYNLIFMLASFLASEGIKNYKFSFSIVLFVLGAIQICRIFIYPMMAHGATVDLQGEAVTVMGDGQFVRCVIYLVCSAACLIASAVIGAIRSRTLAAHMATITEKAA